MKEKPTHVRLDARLADYLKSIAKKQRRSMSAMVNIVVESWMQKEQKP